MKDTKRVAYLKKSIKYYELLGKRKNLKGNRPYVAVSMTLGVLKTELARALAGQEPMYKAQDYSEMDNTKVLKTKKKAKKREETIGGLPLGHHKLVAEIEESK